MKNNLKVTSIQKEKFLNENRNNNEKGNNIFFKLCQPMEIH